MREKITLFILAFLILIVPTYSLAGTACDSALLRLGGIGVCYADENGATKKSSTSSVTLKKTENEKISNSDNTDQLLKLTPKYISENQELKEAYDQLILDYINNERRRLNEINEVVARNNWKSTFIFWVVHALLFLSISAAIYEFVKSRILMRWSSSKTELSIEAQKIAIKTSLQGVILLCFSLAFYFLYLKFAHQIVEIGG